MDLPVLTGLSLKEWKAKDPEARALLHQALDLLDLLERKKGFSLKDVSEVHMSKKDGLTLYTLDGGIPIRVGRGELEDKLNRLEKVMPDLRNKLKDVEYLLLDYQRRVVVKMKDSGREKARKS